MLFFCKDGREFQAGAPLIIEMEIVYISELMSEIRGLILLSDPKLPTETLTKCM